MGKKKLLKYLLTRAGGCISQETLYNLNAAVNYVAVGQWMRQHGYSTHERLDFREELFDRVGAQVAGKEVLYLEFGVFDGAATRYWSRLLGNPHSKLHGFDTFEGLPENWLPQRSKGCFSTGGVVPQIDDPRVRFFRGYFEDTLAGYRCPSCEVLILNMDADLYSSTKCVLDRLREDIVLGTYIYFDEFNHQGHELRAFDEFISVTGMRFEVVGVTQTLAHVAFRRIG
jgi:hypothetical protein